jgi:hypothetical protein
MLLLRIHYMVKQDTCKTHDSSRSQGISLQHMCMRSPPHGPWLPTAALAGFYTGGNRSKSVANVLFGMGAAALVLTNKRSLARKAKYKLMHSVRAHVGQDDRVYHSMGIFEGDADGGRIKYTADVPMAATKAIRAAVSMVGGTPGLSCVG